MSDVQSYSIFDVIGTKGKKVIICPRTGDLHTTEIRNKKGEYLGLLAFDKRKKWNQFVLVELDEKMQMSKDCIDEAFDMTNEYWRETLIEEGFWKSADKLGVKNEGEKQ